MKKSYLFLSIAIAILFIAIIVVNQKNLTLSPDSNSICAELAYNDENAINILYISDKETAERYSNYFFSNSPFNENKNAFNVYVLENYEPECEIYKGIALLCYSRDLIKEASKCPNDYIIVPKEMPESIRSSSYDRVISINTLHEMPVLLHEFGHSFASLSEEYTPSSLSSSSPNCKETCDQFQNGCFEGCSKSDYKRSIENGVMRTLSSTDYGEFNKNLIINLIAKRKSTITGNAISNPKSCNNAMYLIELSSDSEINSISLTNGCPARPNGRNSFNTVSRNQEKISEGSFSREIYTDVPGEEGLEGQVFQSDRPVYITIPATSEDNTITIQNENEEVTDLRTLDRMGATPCII